MQKSFKQFVKDILQGVFLPWHNPLMLILIVALLTVLVCAIGQNAR